MKFSRFCVSLFFFLSTSLMAADLPVLSESTDKEVWREFAKVGCGYYPIPENLKQYLPAAIALAKSPHQTEARLTVNFPILPNPSPTLPLIKRLCVCLFIFKKSQMEELQNP